MGALTRDLGLGALYLALAFLAVKVLRDGPPNIFTPQSAKFDTWRKGVSGEALESFKDIGGCPQILEELSELKENIPLFTAGQSKISLTRGVMLEGGPGVRENSHGSRAGRGSRLSLPLHNKQGSLVSSSFMGSWTHKYYGYLRRHVQPVMHLQKSYGKRPGASGTRRGVVIVFLDEFDTIGKKRP